MTVGIRVRNRRAWQLFRYTLTSFDSKLVNRNATISEIRVGDIVYRKIIAGAEESYRGFRFDLIVEFGEFVPHTKAEMSWINANVR